MRATFVYAKLDCCDFGGTWVITQGTGAYAALHGGGTWSEADDANTGNLIFTLVGAVHFD